MSRKSADDSKSTSGSPDRKATRRRWVGIAALFTLTLFAGLAARLHAAGAPSDPGDPAGLQRQIEQAALHLGGRLDRGAVRVGGDGRVHLELVATGATLPDRAVLRRPTDVVVVLDRSGSMGGDPMTRALAAIRELIGQLGAQDRFALVTYSNGSELPIPLASATSQARSDWRLRLGQIPVGGGTNMSAGLDAAHRLVASTRSVGRVARVVLLSDGHANQGDATPDGLARRSARALTGEYVLSTVGVGLGFDERLMTRLADAGTGNFYYVADVEALSGIFESEFSSARETVASALEIRIDTPPGVEVLEAAGYPIEFRDGHVLIRPGSLFAGQQRSFWVTLRVPASAPVTTSLGAVRLAYRDADGRTREARLPGFPPIAAVVEEERFVASLDAEAVKANHAEEVVNRLRQTVAELVSRGEYDAAEDELAEVRFDDLDALGIRPEETESFGAIEELKKKVGRASAAPAARQAEVQSELGKSLYEAGTDGRRKGAKR